MRVSVLSADGSTSSHSVHICTTTVLQDHKANPPEKSDLVQVMLTARDKETGLGLPEQNVKYNVRPDACPIDVDADVIYYSS